MEIKKIKILEATGYQQYSTANPFTSKLGQMGQISSLAGTFKTASRIFINYLGCQTFILCEIHCYLCPHIFWVYYFSLSQCVEIFIYQIFQILGGKYLWSQLRYLYFTSNLLDIYHIISILKMNPSKYGVWLNTNTMDWTK